MVTIELQQLGKRFNRHWIFRHLSYTFEAGTTYAITGANGSGKSTLLQVLAGAVTLSEGKAIWTTDAVQHPGMKERTAAMQGNHSPLHDTLAAKIRQPFVLVPEQHQRYLSVAAPYLELIEEMTLTEFLEFHFRFKPVLQDYTVRDIIEWVQLKPAAHRQIRHYSSGMKQRVKLAQAIFSDVPVVLLDEPLSNLDSPGTDLYYRLIENFCTERLLIICSNNEPEMVFCKKRLAIDDFGNEKQNRSSIQNPLE